MKYDREWLRSIDRTRELIKNCPIDQIPVKDRSLIRQQFLLLRDDFYHQLDHGLDTTATQQHLLDLACLAVDLIEEHDRVKADYCPALAHPAYGR